MRTIALLLAIIAATGCATSSSTGAPTLRQTCEDRYTTVWGAAQLAVVALGGKVVNASEAGGLILGKLAVDVLGSEVELHITVTRYPDHRPGTIAPVTVSVTAREPGISEPDEYRREELRSLEEQYLALVGQRAACGSPMGSR